VAIKRREDREPRRRGVASSRARCRTSIRPRRPGVPAPPHRGTRGTRRIEPNRTALTPKAELGRRQAIDGLRDNLRQLQSLHERLRFMLKEIEELSGDDKK